MKMHNPPHPGEVLRQLCLEPLNLTVTDAARSLGVSRKALSSILNGRAGISPEMAVRLSMAFDTSSESWLNQQVQYDLWRAEKNRKSLHVEKLSRSRKGALPRPGFDAFFHLGTTTISESERASNVSTSPHTGHR
jgi:addiction module HigA family antidote